MNENKESVESFSWNVGKISCLVYEVKRGTKPASEITVPSVDFPALEHEVRASGLLFHSAEHGLAHRRLWLYRHAHMGKVIKHLDGHESHSEIFNTWVWGKLFGYSEDCIAEFMRDV